MKSLVVFLRILIVGCLWGIVFTEGIRVIMLCNWHFDIFWPDHWRQAIALWKAGWVVRAPKEWAFVLLIVTFFPMLITGWWTLSMVAWEDIIMKILTFPVYLYRKLVKTPVNLITTNNKYGVVKRKSYKQIRPAGVGGIRVPISDYGDAATPAASTAATSYTTPASFAALSNSAPKPAPKKTTDVAATIDHALFKFDDGEDFDLDIDSFEKTDIKKKETPASKSGSAETSSKPAVRFDFDDDDDDDENDIFVEETSQNRRKNQKDTRRNEKSDRRGARENSDNDTRDRNRQQRSERDTKSGSADKAARSASESNSAHSPVYDALVQKNYTVLSKINIGSSVVDYIGVSGDEICLCLVDREAGDWLADEEMFNGEEPLWFSESSHRISPVRKLSIARDKLAEKLDEEGFEQKLSSFVVIQMANIINADDMFEIWAESDIAVTRINRGAPKEIKLFSKALNEAGTPMSKKNFERFRNILDGLK